jgi:hypothetical protein
MSKVKDLTLRRLRVEIVPNVAASCSKKQCGGRPIATGAPVHLFPRELTKLSRPHLTAPRLEMKRNVKQ